MSYGIVLHGKKDEIRKHTEAMTAIAPTVAYKDRSGSGNSIRRFSVFGFLGT